MSLQIDQAAITQYWYVLEQLSLFDLEDAIKGCKLKEQIPVNEQDDSLPWINPDILTEKIKPSNPYCDIPEQIEYQVFLGIFPSSSVTDYITALPTQVQQGFRDIEAKNSKDSCYASIKINANGFLIDESLQCAAAPWALKKIGEILAGEKRVSVDSWTGDFYNHVQNLQQKFTNKALASNGLERKFTITDLKKLLNLITEDLWRPKALKYLGYYIIRDASWKPDDGASDIINSYYLQDLAASSAAIKAGTASIALQQYLSKTANVDNRRNVEETSFLYHWLSPKYLTLGRWASEPSQNLSLMQQLAVNLAIVRLTSQDGLFSVNGPPGTGKTTLLRDLIADLLVQRASRMVAYDDPEEAFIKQGDFYCPPSALTGFEIVVASSNNAAVENVTLELPAIEAIDEKYRESASYFREVSENIKSHLSGKQSSNRRSESKPRLKSDLEREKPPAKTWGLIAAALGKKDNCNKFCQGFWWKDKSMRACLSRKTDQVQWDDARRKFFRCRQAVQNLINQREEWYQQLTGQRPTSQEQLIMAKSSLGEAFGDADWWSRSHEELQLSAPWVDKELNQARTELFLAALNVHEQFIRQAAEPIKTNLDQWVKLVKGEQKKLSDDQILQLWQTFFLVVPVASTTLASMRRLLGRLPVASLGWLLIDEAGQATPQAAVGALQRTKRAVIVGDPLQIEPIFPEDVDLAKHLQNYFKVENCWSPTEASIQTLCDRSNPLGAEVIVRGEPLWIGCPLWVHRRCIEPMVNISNKIAYGDKMVLATRSPQKSKHFPLGESRWIDIEGKCQDKQWVKAQGDKVVDMLAELVRVEEATPDLYIISPFKRVADNLKKLLREKKPLWATHIADLDVDGWIGSSVGTVHTFQGKEAEIVIFVLGGDDSRMGALNWASEKPNILNVAATRAKYRMYVIGSHRLWSKLQHFDEASYQLPCEKEPVKYSFKPSAVEKEIAAAERLGGAKVLIKQLKKIGTLDEKYMENIKNLSIEEMEMLGERLFDSIIDKYTKILEKHSLANSNVEDKNQKNCRFVWLKDLILMAEYYQWKLEGDLSDRKVIIDDELGEEISIDNLAEVLKKADVKILSKGDSWF
jgi:AAA domain/Domain of unknown function (DUF4351)